MSEKKANPSDATELRQRAEERERGQAKQWPHTLDGLSPEEARRILHELRVHQIELEMQNEELRRSQVDLDAARAHYFEFYDLAPVGFFTVSERGQILEANLTAAGLLGVARNALVRQRFTSFVLREDQDIYYQHRKQLFGTGEPQQCELRMVATNGTPFWVRLQAAAAGQVGGSPVGRIVMSDITARKEAEEVLRETVSKLELVAQEKTVLLQEIHHRVKNNLAVVSSLLLMQADASDSAEAKLVLDKSQRRVHSMALIHAHLYGGGRFDRIDFSEYANELVQGLHSATVSESSQISLEVDLEPIELGMDQAVPCALILNELFSNALKHAFRDGRPGKIHVSFRESEPGFLELAVEDNGIGLPVASLGGRDTGSLGLRIVSILTGQLGGSLKQEPSQGARIVFRFPAPSGVVSRTPEKGNTAL